MVEVGVSEQDQVDIALRIARGGEVAEQSAGRFLELVDAAACADQSQLVAGVDQDGVDLQPHRARRLEPGCEKASCVLGPIAPQGFGRERERAVTDDGDLNVPSLKREEPGCASPAWGAWGGGGGGLEAAPSIVRRSDRKDRSPG
jgi:hypothetical protein